MRRLESRTLGIDQGSLLLFSDFKDGGEMWTGAGARELQRDIAFSEPFVAPPNVQVSLSMWDIDSAANIRADISSAAVSERGFTIVFRTWGDTRIARVRADWLALGPLSDDDLWDVP
ncbi:H-type lectin domain-containing protein [Tranquillimonas rosea]|uniref:H-type lectin domain-containing protein n=1 Tax=Tranquillimonas rosea TaxID=641238 RepID=A0A1H9RJ07_9RHOB|nr:H-type lectin domain-containing protein [Tranquillimonas rosea]SER72525.1 H-type lectin domain-containing protein [Tranquillimonas rosea]